MKQSNGISMHGNKSVVCVIPARLNSTRFPRKMLALLKGKPLVQWAYEGAMGCPLFDHVIVAVDSQEVAKIVKQFGGEAMMTDPACESGTDRLAQLQQEGKVKGDIWVNWQGDEPFISSLTIETLLQSIENQAEEIWTLKKKIANPKEIESPHVVKVVCNQNGKALYFSRSIIPYGNREEIFKHIGIYAFSESALQKITTLSPSPLERAERLEQLRFLDHGMSIHVHETNQEIFGIDTPDELRMAEEFDLCYDC